MKYELEEEPDLMGWAIHRTAVKLANSHHPGPIADELVWAGGSAEIQFEDILRARIMNICRVVRTSSPR